MKMNKNIAEKMGKKLRYYCVAGWMLFPSTTLAEQDTGIWAVTNLTAPLTDKISTNLEAQWRFLNDGASFSQRLLRPSITYKLDEHLTVTAGYVHVLTNPAGKSAFNENRPWQQIGYTLYTNDYGLTISGRSRIEQRFVENSDDVGWRFRQFLRIEAPFQAHHEIKAVAWSELFYGLNDTEWKQRDELDQTRHFLGVHVPVSDSLKIEAGYLNQFINNTTHDPVNHVLATYLNVTF